ncbi:MAG: ATP-binding protein [Thermoanaerobaculia bacterium]
MSRASGLRREAPILLPASLLLFTLLAAVTLLSYRAAVARFADEREQATLKLAGALADALRLAKSDDIGPLARWLPQGATLAVYDARGGLRSSLGFADADGLAAAVPRAAEIAFPRSEGLGVRSPGEPAGSRVLRAFVPYERATQRYLLRLEVPEPVLLAQQRSLRILTPAVFGLSAAVALLAIFFLRALVRPYEELLERARTVVPAGPLGPGSPAREPGDEVEFLLATFDRALAALRHEPLDELSAVERTLGPQLESGLLMFDRDGRLLAANPAAIELLGGDSRAAGVPAPAIAAKALAAHPALAGLVSTAITDRRSIPRASVAIERAGQQVELGLTLQALRAGFLVLFADVTDLSRREAEERFATGLAQLGELSAGVAHELRNSLATVQGYLTMAARRELPAAAREEITEAQREAAELARIVDDFLTFARPDSGVVEPVDLAALLLRATRDPALGGVPFELVPAETPLPPIAGDPHLLQRALRNLLLNAAQATLARAATSGLGGGPGGAAPEPVVVRLRRDGGAATITIDDRGTGLAPAVRDRLFEPFASGRPGGAGLGLALARRIILMHGGRLELLPREPHGVRAKIRLPLGESVT